MENKNTILTYDEMQDLLADYIFNRIPEKDKELFKLSLPQYPDIQKEVLDVRAVFNRLEKMDIDKNISNHTRNLSIKVNQRIANNSKSKRFRSINKYLIPTFGLAVIIILFITHNFNINDSASSNKRTVASKNFIKFNENDLKGLDNSNIAINLQNNPQLVYSNKNSIAELNSEELENTYDEILEEYFNNGELDKINNLNDLGIISQYDLLEQVSSFKEEDIQYLLKEIQDAKFNS